MNQRTNERTDEWTNGSIGRLCRVGRVLVCDNRAPPGSSPRAAFLSRLAGALREIQDAVNGDEGPVTG